MVSVGFFCVGFLDDRFNFKFVDFVGLLIDMEFFFVIVIVSYEYLGDLLFI